MSEPVVAEPLAILLTVGHDAALRRELAGAVRAMDPAHDPAIISGRAETLEADLDRVLATDRAGLAVVELHTADDIPPALDTVEALVEDEAAVLLGVLAIVDVRRFWEDFFTEDRGTARHLVAMIESASLVVLAGEEAEPADDRPAVEGFVRNLNPLAAVLPLESLAGLSLPELAEAIAEAEAAGDLADREEDDVPLAGETDAWGFNSFTWTTETPLDRGRFMALFENWPLEILRAHGVARFADGATAVLSVVRDTVAIDEYGGDDLHDHDHDESILPEGDEDALMDGESELAFVGQGMPVPALVAWLEACQAEE